MSDDASYPDHQLHPRHVHVVDPDVRNCEALSVLFRLEGFHTSFSTDASMFLAALSRHRPDVVISSMRVGAIDGLTLLRRVKALRTGAPVFMLLDEPDVPYAVEAMKQGASDVLTKPIDGEELVRSVREALRENVQIRPTRRGRRPIEVRGFSQLTPREREVLELITNGQSNKEAGRELGISPRTIEVHRARVMDKLGAKNTADLMRIVLTG
ncbi:MAG TPA: LuxR C-terminal-related transcriptional regulator [Devosia sp.]|nr:LuxR C-terminal-related transcriptional regulator [Devosia sp.]